MGKTESTKCMHQENVVQKTAYFRLVTEIWLLVCHWGPCSGNNRRVNTNTSGNGLRSYCRFVPFSLKFFNPSSNNNIHSAMVVHFTGVPTEYGLYSSFLGPIVYIFLGSCKEVPIGPSAISALMTFQAINGRGVPYAVLLCFLTGLLQTLMGVFGLGKSIHLKRSFFNGIIKRPTASS